MLTIPTLVPSRSAVRAPLSLLDMLLALTRGPQADRSHLFGQGELSLVSTGVAASGAGELSGEPVRERRRFPIVRSGSG